MSGPPSCIWLATPPLSSPRGFDSTRRRRSPESLGWQGRDRWLAPDSSQVPRIYKAMARCGLPAEVVIQLSGHGARIGAAQGMIATGIDMPANLHAGHWKTPAIVTRYGERLLVRRSGAVLLARLQRSGWRCSTAQPRPGAQALAALHSAHCCMRTGRHSERSLRRDRRRGRV